MDTKLLVFVLGLSFAFTGFVYERVDTQQDTLDTLIEIQKADAARVCMSLPSEDERLECLNKVYPPAEKGEDE